jgi:glycosyltransferase involved in cell wall biosynthesis
MPRRVGLQLISTAGFYGAERVVVDLAAHMGACGWDSRVAVLDSPGAGALVREAERHGVPTRVLPAPNRAPWTAVAALGRLVDEAGVRVVHAHGYKADVCAALLPRATVRKVSTCHTWYSEGWKLRLYEAADKLALRAFDHVAVVSPSLLAEVRRAGVAPSRSSLVENGVGFAPPPREAVAALGAALRRGRGERLVVRVGRLARSKGNHLLLEAVAGLGPSPGVRVVFVGEGEEGAGLAAQARALGLQDRVDFMGFRDDVYAFVSAADVLVSCSLKEGLPLVLLEAMAAGKPVVATSVGAVPSVIVPGRNGWLVPPGDAAALGAALKEALTDEAAARARAEQARADYEASHSREAMGRRYLAIYASVLGAAAGATGATA